MTDTLAAGTKRPKWHSIFLHSNRSRSINHLQNNSIHSSDNEFYLSSKSELKQAENYLARVRFRSPYVSSRDLRNRELGSQPSIHHIRDSTFRSLKPWRSWTGASKDVLSVAWGQDDYFAIGAGTDHVDRRDLPYNRSNNLLLGYAGPTFSCLESLPGHSICRPIEQIRSDPRQNSPDPDLHMTVSHVLFSHHHRSLYSASYDKTVRVWDLPASQASSVRCKNVLRHSDKVDLLGQMLTCSDNEPQVLATAQHSKESPINLFAFGTSDSSEGRTENDPMTVFRSPRADKHDIYPSSMEWGPDMWTRRYLLVGFSEAGENSLSEKQGHVCLWDVTARSLEPIKLISAEDSVFGVAWAPGCKIVAAALAHKHSNNMTYRGLTKSVIRTWSPDEGPGWRCEFECPALDINDVRFHPANRNLVTASCTDGRTYVWDARNQDKILAVLAHGDPIEELDHFRRREEQDVGVRFATWDREGRFLYTGSSDGRVGCWDILVSPEDALVQEVIGSDSGVMAGSFSADGTKLLLGTVKGSVEILSVGATSEESEDENLHISSTEQSGSFDKQPKTDDQLQAEEEISGVEEARKLLEDGRLILDPLYGVGQGPAYDGPFEMACRIPGFPPHVTNFMPNVAACQFDPVTRKEGLRRGGKTTDMADRCRYEAMVLQKQRQILQRQRQRAECPNQPEPRSPADSPPTSRPSSAVERDDLSVAVGSNSQGDQSMNNAKRPRPVDYRSPIPERKRSRQATPVSLPLPSQSPMADGQAAFVFQNKAAPHVTSNPIRPTTPAGPIATDAANSSPRSGKLTPRRQGMKGFIIPPTFQRWTGSLTDGQDESHEDF